MNKCSHRSWVAETFVLLSESAPRTGYTVKQGDDVICDIYHDSGWTKAEVKAHAQLIAAAPRLRRELGKAYRELRNQGVDVQDPSMKAVRKALNAAKGKA